MLAVIASQAHAFVQEDIATLSRLAAYVSSAIGLAHDLSRVNAELLDLTSH